MSIIEQLIFISFLLVCGFGVVVAQSIALGRIFRTRAWWLLASAMLLIGLRQVWGLLRLPAAILKAQRAGIMPERLSLEQWVTIGAGFLAIGLLIMALDTLRRDLRRIGI